MIEPSAPVVPERVVFSTKERIKEYNRSRFESLVKAGWDLVVVDEAHKMSAHYYGREFKPTGRFKLGQILGKNTRHLLLMTATPHNGKEEEFQLFFLPKNCWRIINFNEPKQIDVRKEVNTILRRMNQCRLEQRWEKKPRTPKMCNNCNLRFHCDGVD